MVLPCRLQPLAGPSERRHGRPHDSVTGPARRHHKCSEESDAGPRESGSFVAYVATPSCHCTAAGGGQHFRNAIRTVVCLILRILFPPFHSASLINCEGHLNPRRKASCPRTVREYWAVRNAGFGMALTDDSQVRRALDNGLGGFPACYRRVTLIVDFWTGEAVQSQSTNGAVGSNNYPQAEPKPLCLIATGSQSCCPASLTTKRHPSDGCASGSGGGGGGGRRRIYTED